MEVRVCPGCGTENKKSRSSCANCYASLAAVPATQSGAGAQPAAPQGRTLSGAPMGTQPRPPAPPPGAEQRNKNSEPASGGSLAWLFILFGVLLVIGVVAFVGLKMRPFVQMAAQEPKVPADKVVTSFLEAKKARDYEKVKPFLSEESIKTINVAFSGKQMASAGFGPEDSHKMYLWEVCPTPRQLNMSTYTVKPIASEEAAKQRMRVVRVNLAATEEAKASQDISDMTEIGGMAPEVDFFLVKEKGEWKIDVVATNRNISGRPIGFPK